MRPKLLLLTRPECGLCDELEAELLAHFGAAAFELQRADVDSRPDWRQRYGLKIPVLLAADGEMLCSVRLDAEAVACLLQSPA
jgi:hypothetical protein